MPHRPPASRQCIQPSWRWKQLKRYQDLDDVRGVIMQTTHRCAVGKRGFTLQSWEIDHLRSGDEPERSDLWEFYLLYECGDWKIRWESVRERIVGEWLCMPKGQRPSDWIRYLVRFQYLSTEVGNLLLQSEAAPTKAAGEAPPAAVMPI